MTWTEGVRMMHLLDPVKFPLGAILFYDRHLRLRPSSWIQEYRKALNNTYGSRYWWPFLMINIFQIFLSKPFVFLQMVLLSLFANVLALITPIFVILVFNRYVSAGVDATLTTLAIGAFIAIAFEYFFRRARYFFAERLVEERFLAQDQQIFSSIAKAQYLPVSSLEPSQLRSYFGLSSTLKTVYSPANLSKHL